MTVKTIDPEVKLQQNLDARNKEVERAYQQIIDAMKPLLSPFDGRKYRTFIQVDHTKSGKETKLISEFICFFWNLTLTQNIAGYRMIYFSYDEESIARFGARTYNRVLRQVLNIPCLRIPN